MAAAEKLQLGGDHVSSSAESVGNQLTLSNGASTSTPPGSDAVESAPCGLGTVGASKGQQGTGTSPQTIERATAQQRGA